MPDPSQVVLDHVGDANGVELYRLSQLYQFPAYVKQASSDDLYPDAGLAATAYADPVRMLYPCHNRPSTWLSALYFAEKQAEYHPKDRARVASRLDYYTQYWGIKAALDQIRARHAELYKDAESRLPDSAFGYVQVYENGVKERHLRMTNSGEVKAAADWLLRYRDELPWRDRNVIAGRIMEKAARFGVGLKPDVERFVEKQAGQGVCDPKEVVEMVRQRVHFTKVAAERDQLVRLADSIAKAPRFALQPAQLVKLAEVMEDVDRRLNLFGRYTDVIRRPEDVIFKVTYKEAQAGIGSAVALTTGNVYDRAEFRKISLDNVQALMGSDFAKEVAAGLDVDVEKLAEMAETMPRDDAALFEQLLQETGIPPIHHRKSAGDRYGLRADAMQKLAMGY